jgi:hypothetical protein
VKTFLRKAKLSSIAMCIGWAACNLTVWSISALYAIFTPPTFIETAWLLGIFAIASGLVIASVWLVIFLPVDLIVGDSSPLRSPAKAALAGLASAFAFTIIPLGAVLALNGSFEFTQLLLPQLLLTGVTGSVAAYVRCRLETQKTTN